MYTRSFAAVTFSVPEETLVTIKGDFWLAGLPGAEVLVDPDCNIYNAYPCAATFQFCDSSRKVPFCSPSLAVLPGEFDDDFSYSDNALQIAKPAVVGWSSFEHTFKTQPGSSHVTVYLTQESGGPVSSSYFANLEIMSTRVRPLPTTISVPAEEPLTIDCNLANWRVNNAFVRCGLEHEGRYNVLEVSDDESGFWSDLDRKAQEGNSFWSDRNSL